jgi:hypothetical protein
METVRNLIRIISTHKLLDDRKLTACYLPVSLSSDNEVTIFVCSIAGFMINAVRSDEAILAGDNSLGVLATEERTVSR